MRKTKIQIHSSKGLSFISSKSAEDLKPARQRDQILKKMTSLQTAIKTEELLSLRVETREETEVVTAQTKQQVRQQFLPRS